MRVIRYFAIFAVVAGLSFFAASPAKAQFSVTIGAPPACSYGYYSYAPYNCAPYGYYGDEWFAGGVFIGAGPWFHGPRGWHGRVDDRFDPRHGYRGDYPRHGDHDHFQSYDHGQEFHGNSTRGGYENHENHGDHGDHDHDHR